MYRPILLALTGAVLAGCQTTAAPDVTRLIEPSVIRKTDATPPDGPAGTCWGHEPGPEVTVIVSETVVVHPAKLDANGKEISPAIYRKTRGPKTVNDGSGLWFERICNAELTPDFIQSVQRALQARGLYRGEVTGQFDPRTGRAVRHYQKEQGLNSAILSKSAAQQLGLVTVELEDEAEG